MEDSIITHHRSMLDVNTICTGCLNPYCTSHMESYLFSTNLRSGIRFFKSSDRSPSFTRVFATAWPSVSNCLHTIAICLNKSNRQWINSDNLILSDRRIFKLNLQDNTNSTSDGGILKGMWISLSAKLSIRRCIKKKLQGKLIISMKK